MRNYRASLSKGFLPLTNILHQFYTNDSLAMRQTEKVWPCTVSPVNGKGKQRYIFMELTLIIRTHFDKLVEGMKRGMMRI